MVVKRLSIVVLFILFPVLPFFSQTEIHGSVGFNTGFLHTEGQLQTDALFSGSAVSLRVEHSTAAVKAVIEGSSILSASPFLPSPFLHKFSIDKAYFKTRIPFIHDSFMRLSIGKMPISWGYGLIYNSGDILYSGNSQSAPLDSALSDLNKIRSFTDWAFHIYLPFSDLIIAEAAFLPQLEQNFVSENSTRSALRVQIFPYARFLECAEIGSSIQNDNTFKKIDNLKLYAGLDGTLFIDYNLCSSIEFSPSENIPLMFNKDAWSLSGSLYYSFSKFNIRTEALYHPMKNAADIFSMLSFSIFTNLSAQALYTFSYKEESITGNTISHLAGAGLQWNPVKGFTLSLTGSTNIKKTDTITDVYTSVMVSGIYNF